MGEEFSKKIAVISIDVEEWFHLEYFKNSKCDKSISTLDGLDNFIDLINKNKIKSSFFIVGELIEYLKTSIKKLDETGHDISLHSFFHERPITLSENDFDFDIKSVNELKNILAQIQDIDQHLPRQNQT